MFVHDLSVDTPDGPGAPGVPAHARAPRRGELIEVEVRSLAARGGALGTYGPWTVELDRGVPGERARARVLRRRGERIRAWRTEVVEAGPQAVEARCVHFGTCGGCSFQGLAYARQLAELERLLAADLEPLARAAGGPLPIAAAIPSARTFHYRNKMDFTFGARRWIDAREPRGVEASFALGLHVAGHHEKVLDIASCAIAFEEASGILADARTLARERGLEPWDLAVHRGLLRHLVLRKGFATGEILVALVTSEEARALVDPYARALLAKHPEITTLVQLVNPRVSLVAVGERERVLFGPGTIGERLAGLAFQISAQSFFQVNTAQAEVLVEHVRAAAGLTGREVLWDLCCGGGTFALALASRAREVIGVELAASAVADARANAARNGIPHARFLELDLARLADEHTRSELGLPAPDVCIVDPPRAGLPAAVVELLHRLAPPRLVYVACNARSAARDLAGLAAASWRVVSVQPVDLFPHTPHMECVIALESPAATTVPRAPLPSAREGAGV